jgi:hypothetical protein
MMKALFLVVCGAVAATAPAFAQQPNTVNTRVVARAPEPDVSRAISAIVAASADTAWIGYSVPATIGDAQPRHDGWSERCRLEQQSLDPATNLGLRGPLKLEPTPTVFVLLRVQNREIQRIRSLSADCVIDAAGLTLYWLGDVNGAQSVNFLKALVTEANLRDRAESALSSLALHRDESATAAVIDLARNSPSSRIRERALFWVARRATSQSVGVITYAIENDPETRVKKQAVFALSQLPKDEGVPLLITLARSHTNPVVRRQAMQWLGQSRDPRALAFFEEVLR